MPRVDHLVRRGDRYHWRVRVPARLRARKSHLAISLGTADRSVAEQLARRLNEVLAEMIDPTADAEALERVFRETLATLQDVHASDLRLARSRGRQTMIAAAVEAQHRAWASHLLDQFGAVDLTFTGGCPALAYLRMRNAPTAWIDDIANEYLSQVSIIASPFAEFELNDELASRGIRTSEASRQALVRARLRAGAAAATEILNAGLPDLPPESAEVPSEATPSMIPIPTSTKEPAPNAEESVIRVHAPPQPVPAGPAFPGRDQPSSATGEDLAIDDLVRQAEVLCTLRKKWDLKTQRQAVQIVRMFQALLVEEGVRSVAGITQRHVAALRLLMEEVPTRYGQGLRPGKPFPSPAELKRQAEKARAAGKSVGLDTNTVRRHFVYVRAFLDHLKAQGFAIARLELDGLIPSKKTKSRQRAASEKFPTERFASFFRFPMFSGCAGEDAMDQPGPFFIHCGQTLAPIALLYNAARRDEVANADVDDIVDEGNVLCFHFRFTEHKRLKTELSERFVPVPDELLRLGFVDYVQAIRQRGHKKLFPDLCTGPGGKAGDELYKATVRHIGETKKLPGHSNFKQWPRFFHSFRHSVNNLLSQKVPDAVLEDLLGHAPVGTGNVIYRNLVPPAVMMEAMQLIPNVTSHISHDRIRLLSSVDC